MAHGTGLVGNTNAVLNIKYKGAVDLAEALDELNIKTGIAWEFGVGINQCNVLYHDIVTLANPGNNTIDLFSDATLTDAFGNSLDMKAIKFLYIRNKSADATLQVGGGGTNDLLILSATGAEDGILYIPQGGFFMWAGPTAAGIDISTDENLYLKHGEQGSDTMDVEIVAMGISD